MSNEFLKQSPFHLCFLVLSLACLKLDTPLAGTWQLSVRILYTTQHIPDTHPVSSRAKLSQNNTGCNERKHRHMLLITDHYKWYDDAHTRPWSQHNTIVDMCALWSDHVHRCWLVTTLWSLMTMMPPVTSSWHVHQNQSMPVSASHMPHLPSQITMKPIPLTPASTHRQRGGGRLMLIQLIYAVLINRVWHSYSTCYTVTLTQTKSIFCRLPTV